MAFESLNNEGIADLLNCSKRVRNPHTKSKVKEGHEQINYKVDATDDSGHEFEVYKRQNLREGMEDDFSCGISWVAPNGETLTLKRYNGPSHDHPNHLENIKLGRNAHIHFATDKYIKANRKAEGFAEVTKRYYSVEGALNCLVTDCKISGIQTTPDDTSQLKLFEE